MAKRRKPRFTPITIRSRDDLDLLFEYVGDVCNEGLSERHVKNIRGLFDRKGPACQLLRWARNHEVDVCSTGIRKITAEAGKLTSWRQYIEKHWGDRQARQWFTDNAAALSGQFLYVNFFATFDEWLSELKNCGPIHWASWPFPRGTKRQVKRQPKKSKRR